ncbi:MAG: divergent polysaccharide deacetylase family protein [Chromatiales bacterium]|nr:MAG: divergent polysaccharide deacetylase family protein [Chromatiales bacterium]
MADENRWPTLFRLVGLSLLLLGAGAAFAEPRIAVIIDDLGNLRGAGERTAALRGPVAFAILPHTPHAAYLANLANDSGKEVLLHLPLEPVQNDNARGIGNIELNLSRGQFSRILGANLASVPHVTGVNTHMGSLITQHPGHMSWLMRELDQRGDLFFVDSRTTAASVALQMALEYGVPATRRDVFLDDDPDPRAIAAQFDRLKNLARVHGEAVAIGHPRPGTLDFLERSLPRLADEGIELVPVRAIIRGQQMLAAQ